MCDEKIADISKTLVWVNYQIADLLASRLKLEQQLMDELQHDKKNAGSKTYKIDKYKIEVKAPYTDVIDIKKYHELQHKLPKELDPVISSVKYSISKKILKDIEEYGNPTEKLLVSDFYHAKPGKVSIKVGANA